MNGIDRERLLTEFERLVSIDAESYHEAEMKEYLRRRLTALGLCVTEDGAAEALRSRGATAGNLYARLPGDLPGEARLFSAHMDTVSPGRGKRAVRQADGTIRSDGTTVLGADDAAGLVSILEALTVIRERGLSHPDIELLLTVAEEPYSQGSAVADYSCVRAKTAYVLDLAGRVGTAALRAPSLLSVSVCVRGRGAHAGFAPEQGVNALTVTARALARLETGRVSEDTTVNFGTIAGGTGPNVVPAEIRLCGEVRSLRHDEAQARGRLIAAVFREEAEKLGAAAEVTVTEQLRAYAVDPGEPVVRLFRRAAEETGCEPVLVTTFGGSDNNHFARHGLRGIVLACGMNEVHAVHEYTEADELCRSAELTLRLMTMEALPGDGEPAD
ncbi:MAG: M20/M25/M40 family metallo-hydrolase [Oscillospiraceae bacterium]|nr:M20/M25/M40 family metallo-hydrolase [Oscillospiraceae bacterium]